MSRDWDLLDRWLGCRRRTEKVQPGRLYRDWRRLRRRPGAEPSNRCARCRLLAFRYVANAFRRRTVSVRSCSALLTRYIVPVDETLVKSKSRVSTTAAASGMNRSTMCVVLPVGDHHWMRRRLDWSPDRGHFAICNETASVGSTPGMRRNR